MFDKKVDIKEASEKYTREQFLNEACKDSMGVFNTIHTCPDEYRLDYFKFPECKPKEDKTCKECWRKAVRNIRFKGEVHE